MLFTHLRMGVPNSFKRSKSLCSVQVILLHGGNCKLGIILDCRMMADAALHMRNTSTRNIWVGRVQELRMEDCSSDAVEPAMPWEDAMRAMPPLLELVDMFNIVARRCRARSHDADLLKGAPRV